MRAALISRVLCGVLVAAGLMACAAVWLVLVTVISGGASWLT